MTVASLILAIVTGVAFGAIAYAMWRISWQRLALGLTFLALLETFSQLVLRQLVRVQAGEAVSFVEMQVVLGIVVVFGVSACVAVWALGKR